MIPIWLLVPPQTTCPQSRLGLISSGREPVQHTFGDRYACKREDDPATSAWTIDEVETKHGWLLKLRLWCINSKSGHYLLFFDLAEQLRRSLWVVHALAFFSVFFRLRKQHTESGKTEKLWLYWRHWFFHATFWLMLYIAFRWTWLLCCQHFFYRY